jgi:lysophospholipase L1-like esterase
VPRIHGGRAVLLRIATLVASCLLGAIAAEGVLRLRYARIDFLKPRLVADDVLVHRIAPYSGGHDAWGFRNRAVPDRADIIAIGDSLTYGYSATAAESWPSWLARATGAAVYNLGLGGYGPADYLYLLDTRAPGLHPSLAIVGVYFGNDLLDAVTRVYAREHWRDLRQGGPGHTGPPSPPLDPASAEGWLEAHSMLFRLVEESVVGQTINRFADRAGATRDGACSLESGPPFPTVFTPHDRLKALDLSSPEIREGLEITLTLLTRMHQSADRAGMRVIILLLPTKESVYDGLLDGASDRACLDVVRRVVANERTARERIIDRLAAEHTDYVDALPALRAAAARNTERLFLRSGDSHPNGNGYRIIAADVQRRLKP